MMSSTQEQSTFITSSNTSNCKEPIATINETKSQEAVPPLPMTTLSRALPQTMLRSSSIGSDAEEDDNDIMGVDPIEARHMLMPHRRTFLETSREFMRPGYRYY